MKLMVCGFLFNENKTHVALIQKNKPEWQRSLFNGIGGHVEDGEVSWDAMEREFEEETGVNIKKWSRFAQGDSVNKNESRVLFWRGFSDKVFNVETKTDEEVVVVELKARDFQRCIPNLSWLIPLALDKTTGEKLNFLFGENIK